MLAHQLELLSPARDADIGIEAIRHGADAIYLGGPAFGARANAANSIQDIARLVQHAHRYHARVFVTQNTILRDDELEPVRQQIWQLYDAGVDAIIIQDMGLLQIDLPPIQLHASTQTDIRTPEKARFLQDAGLSQLVLARELDLEQIAAIRAATRPETTLEYFIHGALCVAYSGQCYISHASTGRSANRGDCSQACRLPWQVTDSQNRIVAHDKHVLSMKDNDQSANLEELVDAGIRSFKIEGRYKDVGYVKNITAHYRKLLDELLERRTDLAPGSSGQATFSFAPDPRQNFNRGSTDYFTHGRQQTIGAFDSPKNPGQPIGYVTKVQANCVDLAMDDAATALHNGDGLCYFDLHNNLVGMQINRAEKLPGKTHWRIYPKDPISGFKDLRANTVINRNRDMDWVRALERPSAERRIGVWLRLEDTADGVALTLTDAEGFIGSASIACEHVPANDAARAEQSLLDNLGKLGTTCYRAEHIDVACAQPWFLPASQVNALRRSAVEALDAARLAGWQRPARAVPVEPPAPYPEDTLTYLANVFNHKARDFYARHGVKVIASAYEAHEEEGEVPLMITRHCVRFSLSMCPKQAKGVKGVQGQVRAEPLTITHEDQTYTLKFDCKPCEMHVMGKLEPHIRRRGVVPAAEKALMEVPVQFYRTGASR